MKFVREQLRTPGMESKVRVVVAVTTLLLGPLDVGSGIVSKEGVLEMILVMANSDNFLQQVNFSGGFFSIDAFKQSKLLFRSVWHVKH